MTNTRRLELTGAPGSPYTRKMISVLRYRHIPYTIYWGDERIPKGYPAPKIRLLPTFFFPDGENGALVPVTDSTPIIRRLEEDYAGRSVIPHHPVMRLLNSLIEDYGDEWLTKAMFHFRWAFEKDAKNAQNLLIYWASNTVSKDEAVEIAEKFATRQIDRLYVVGSNEITATTIENSYRRLIGILDDLISRKGFVLGARPSSADFAVFGQLTQLTIVEPTSAEITNEISQRVRAWVDLTDDLSGLQPDTHWFDLDDVKEAITPLLGEIGRTYAPAMVANRAAVMQGEASFETEIDGRHWTQPVFKYQAKSLQWLREEYAALSDQDRRTFDDILSGTNCDILFA